MSEHAMSIAWLVVNEVCNNRCSFCYAARAVRQPKPEMTLETAYDALELIDDLGIGQVVLIGGEPTMYDGLLSIISRAKSLGVRPILTTNGRLLAEKKFVNSLLLAGLEVINISLQGVDEENHCLITGQSAAFGETLKGMHNALVAGLRVNASLTISYANHLFFEKVLLLLHGIGVRYFTVGLEIPQIGSNLEYPALYPLLDAMKATVALAAELGCALNFSTPLPHCLTAGTELDGLVGSACVAHHGTGLAIDIQGDVLPCVHWGEYPIDSIYTEAGSTKTADEFLEDWNTGEPLKLRQFITSHFSEKCFDCAADESCFSGCPLLRIGREPSLYIKGLQREAL